MALDYHQLTTLPPIESRQTYAARDSMLYALGVGACLDDPLDAAELAFVYEAGLQALPTMAVVLASPGPWLKAPELGVDYGRMLHGEQSLTLHRPLAPQGEVIGVTQVEAVFDKGPGKGALVYAKRTISDAASGELIATTGFGYFLRGDGGFGGPTEGAPKPRPTPVDREPDHRVRLISRPEQALIYRLSGDYNPLHADPELAASAGFDRPILHGLCTYGFAGRAVLRALCGGVPAHLRRLDARFASPVYPGESLEIEIWRTAPGQAAFRCRAVERDLVVLQHGFAEYED